MTAPPPPLRRRRGRAPEGRAGVKPVLFVTNFAPRYRVGSFRALHEREDIVVALFGGRLHHAVGEEDEELPFPHLRTTQRQVHALAASGRFRAVVASTNGRVALPAAYLGARRARVPFVLWATLWAQPLGPAGIAGYPAVRHVYRHADAVVTYGPHVSAYVRAKGARRVFEAPQATDNDFWAAPPTAHPRRAPFQALFTGRMEREKGLSELVEAWHITGFDAKGAALVLIGDGPERPRVPTGAGIFVEGPRLPHEVRNFYAASDVVVIPSIPTRTFREPWGLVANEAMNQGTPVIATDAVGAAAGGLVRDGRNGLVVPAGDPRALAGAIRRMHDDPGLARRLGAAGREDVRAYTHEAWAEGFSRALAETATAKEACYR